MKLAWLTDTHLNLLRSPEEWWDNVCLGDYDAYLITGDITTGSLIHETIQILSSAKKPVYFCLGNHDMYGTSIERVRGELLYLPSSPAGSYVKYLHNHDVVHLTDKSSLVGDDGWYDGRNGRYAQSDVRLNDFYQIEEFKGLNKSERLVVMQKYADLSARRLKDLCSRAVLRQDLKHLYVATHVPPFAGAAWHMGQVSDENFLPFFSNRCVGDAIMESTHGFRELGGKVMVLCGHCHSEGEINPCVGLTVRTGKSEYFKPSVYDVLEIE